MMFKRRENDIEIEEDEPKKSPHVPIRPQVEARIIQHFISQINKIINEHIHLLEKFALEIFPASVYDHSKWIIYHQQVMEAFEAQGWIIKYRGMEDVGTYNLVIPVWLLALDEKRLKTIQDLLSTKDRNDGMEQD